jgi:hypothetical protein
MIIAVAAVRDRLALNASNSRYSDATIGSNIPWAQSFLEKRTGRIYEQTTATRLFTTEGKPLVTIPGLQAATTVTLNGAELVADETYWLLPDHLSTGIYTGIQFRAFETSGTPWFYSNPEWFDRGLDLPPYYGHMRGSIPNDLSITGTWGYAPASMPEDVVGAVTALAAWATKRGDALFAGGVATPEGQLFDLSQLPVEVVAFIEAWRLGGGGVEAVG